MKRYILCIFAAFALCACQKNEFDSGRSAGDGTVRYAVAFEAGNSDGSATKSVGESDVTLTTLSDESGNLSIAMAFRATDGIVAAAPAPLTKGQQVNTTGNDNTALSTFKDMVSSFVVKAYNAGVEEVSQTVSWSTTGSAWVGSPVAYWPQATNLDFLAYANLPTGQSASISSSGVSTSHTVPSDISKQTDILFGHYEGDGGSTGTAEIRFEHPLTAVRFLYGTMKDSPVVKSISLKGVAQTGTATMTPGGVITWTNVGTRNVTLTQQNSTGLSLTTISGYTSKLIGDTFLIIPQNLADNNVTVSVVFTDGTKVEAKVSTGEWKSGCTNTYVLGYTGGTPQLTLTSGGQPLNGSEIPFDFSGGTQNISINSIIEDEFGVSLGDEPWEAELEFVGAGKDNPWVHLSKSSSDGGEEDVVLSTDQNVVTIKGVEPADVWSALKNATVSGTADNRTDLSGGKETANCYLVKAPGFYKLPLVYGNARKSDGTANTQAFKPTGTGLPQFTDHTGTAISGPYIYDKYTPANCCLIWQDEPDLIRNVSLSSDKHFLQFDIDKTSIYEGNAIVAVRDAAGTILWSWHIWVTNYTMGTGDGSIEIATPQVPSTGKRNIVKYTFAGRPVGFCNPKTINYEGGMEYAYCTITIKQASGKQLSFVVYNEAGKTVAGSNVTYYQWGRKDPMPGGYATAMEGYYSAKSNKPLYYDDAAYTFTQDNSRQSRAYSIQCPHKLIYHYGALGEAADWENTSSTRFNAWNATSVGRTNGYNFKLANYKDYGVYTSVKSVYDPSPAGYKVPVHYPFLLFVPKLGSNPTIPTTVDGTYVTTPIEGYNINALEPVNSGDPAAFFPRTAFRAQATGLDNGSWGVFATCSPSSSELKSATFGFTTSADAGGAWNANDGCPNNMLGLFIATPVQPIREETVTEQTMANQVLFEDNFGTAVFSSVASYDKAGMSGKPYNFKDALAYSGGSNTSVSKDATTNMTGGHLRYSSKTSGNTSTFTIANVRTYGAKTVTLTFDAYYNSYISTHTVSVGDLNANSFSSQTGNSFTFTINGDDPVDIVFNIKHNNSTNTGTVGIDNVKLTFTN